ncbi:hypothetical protein K7X08_024042 [Anisodus acutangulus]|uniref:Uncharacterized protein n=1 Tax=Anisodus acutangulus TaxID=402998 RepID=A0A9Q1MA23_9SOLA|nr:hypothetical protein K7X08_024042 [Anisodus acutangulus]
MGKRGRPRKDQTRNISSVEGEPSQKSQQQEKMASLWSGKVTRMKLEPTIGPQPGFAPSEASPSRPQTRTYFKAVIDRCGFKTATPRSPIRNDKVLRPSCAARDFPAHLSTVISNATKETHAQAAPFPEAVVENNAALNKADVVLNANATEPEMRSGQSGALPTKSMSLNLTKMVALLNGYSSSDDEVESTPDHLAVMVDKDRVKREAAPLLEKIFHKYGDIARNSSFTSVTFSSSLLELVCDTYTKLEATDLPSITSTELQSMLAAVRDLESAKIDVGWLHQRLNDISQAKQLSKDYLKLKETKNRNLVVMETNKKELEELKEELAALQEKIRKKEHELDTAYCENEKIMQRFADSKAKVSGFLKKSLVHDLV